MFQQILEDLKATFGSKIQLSPADIAEIINISEGQQANLRSEGRFPIPYTKDGGRIRISIYALAKYLSECCFKAVQREIVSIPCDVSRTQKKVTRGHLAKGWWQLRRKPIISVVWKTNFENELSKKSGFVSTLVKM